MNGLGFLMNIKTINLIITEGKTQQASYINPVTYKLKIYLKNKIAIINLIILLQN